MATGDLNRARIGRLTDVPAACAARFNSEPVRHSALRRKMRKHTLRQRRPADVPQTDKEHRSDVANIRHGSHRATSVREPGTGRPGRMTGTLARSRQRSSSVRRNASA